MRYIAHAVGFLRIKATGVHSVLVYFPAANTCLTCTISLIFDLGNANKIMCNPNLRTRGTK